MDVERCGYRGPDCTLDSVVMWIRKQRGWQDHSEAGKPLRPQLVETPPGSKSYVCEEEGLGTSLL